jgi:large subunit ribosomal protein L25
MEKVSLTVETREIGKGPAKRARLEGKVPAVLYGRSINPISVLADRREVEDMVKGKSGMNVMIDLKVKGGDSGLALIRDYQADPFRREFTHIDFQAIKETDHIEVEVPVQINGESIGVKEGGILEIHRRTLLIRALPKKIPDNIPIRVDDLKVGDSIHADDITLPEGVEYPHKVNYTVVSIVTPTKIEEVVPVAAPVEGEEAAVPAEGEAAAAAAAPAEGADKGAEAKAADAKAAPKGAEAKGKKGE